MRFAFHITRYYRITCVLYGFVKQTYTYRVEWYYSNGITGCLIRDKIKKERVIRGHISKFNKYIHMCVCVCVCVCVCARARARVCVCVCYMYIYLHCGALSCITSRRATMLKGNNECHELFLVSPWFNARSAVPCRLSHMLRVYDITCGTMRIRGEKIRKIY